MTGPLVPVVMVPRYTTYVGAGEYATAPLNVEPYHKVALTFWTGPLVGQAAPVATFSAYLEESHDAVAWVQCTVDGISQPYDDPGAVALMKIAFKMRWFRIRVVLTADDADVAAITLWAAGSFVERTSE